MWAAALFYLPWVATLADPLLGFGELLGYFQDLLNFASRDDRYTIFVGNDQIPWRHRHSGKLDRQAVASEGATIAYGLLDYAFSIDAEARGLHVVHVPGDSVNYCANQALPRRRESGHPSQAIDVLPAFMVDYQHIPGLASHDGLQGAQHRRCRALF